MKALAAIVLLATLCSAAAVAQAAGGPTGGGPSGGTTPATPAAPSPGTAPSGAASTPAKAVTGQSLFESTLPSDIDTASYYELLAWVRRLGLSEKGSRSELQQRLRAHYKLPPAAPAAASKNERVITVTSARSAEYFTAEKVGQKYIRLSGGVNLKMYDPKTNTTHEITADTIVFNQTEKSITATGNIRYVLTGNQKKEVFRGQSLTFNVENWNGIFFQGVSESQKTIDKNAINFYYTGKTIHRLSNDVVTLDNGTITSSEAIPPNYKVTARKIWVLAPGEWALSNAVLYLGRVPVFYFPFFFHPGDNLFFHPSIGYREEEGYFLQTTTYLLGRRSKVNSSLSFLQVAEDTNVTYNTKIRGFFLRKTSPVTPSEQSKTPYNAQQSYVKLLFDIYSRLGVFAGIESSIVDLGVIKKLQADLSVARSRNIFVNQGAYSQFVQQSDGSFTSIWNSSSLFGHSVPLRYGMDLSLTLTAPAVSVTASLPFYSDPYYQRDFGDRSESINWSKLLGLSGSTTTSSSSTTQSTLAQPLTSLLWSLHTTATPDVSALKPYVTQAAITAADVSVYWPTKNRATTGVVGLDPSLPSYLSGGLSSPLLSDFSFPGRQFFYPQSVVLPSFSGKISGTIYSTPTTASLTAAKSTLTAPEPAAKAASTPGASSPSSPSPSASPSPATGTSTPSDAGSGAAPKGPAPPTTGQVGQAGQGSPKKPVAIPVRPPWEGFTKQKEQKSPTLKVPPERPDLPISTPANLSNYVQSLTYSLTPAASIEDRTVNGSWQSPADINFTNAYSILNTRGTGALTYNGALPGKLMTLLNTVALSGNYKIHYHELPAVTDWQSFLLQDYNASFLKLSDSLSLTTYPFESSELLSGTNFKYTVAADLFSRNWVPNSTGPLFENSFLAWNSQQITTHSLTATIALTPWEQAQNIALTVVLPPLAPEVDLKAVSQAGPLKTTLTGTLTRPTGASNWTSQPFTLDGALTPLPWLLFDEAVSYDFEGKSFTTSVSKLSLFTPDKNVNASETLTYDLQHNYPTDSLTSLKLWFFTMQFEAQRTTTYTFALPGGWTATNDLSFVPSNFSAGIAYDYKSQPLWQNRITFETNINTAWNLNLLQFTNNSLTLDLTGTLSIYKFLDLSFSLKSEDRATYRYFPSFASQLGQTPINPLVDLFKSVNFFNTTDRTQSNFKMQQVDLKLVHHLGDWDLNVEFTGSPELASANGLSYYKWNSTFTLSVNWKPIPEIKSNVEVQGNQISF